MKTVAVYKKSQSAKKHYMLVLEGNEIDHVNNARARQPIIPHEYEIVELGLGESLIDIWLKKYSIKTWSTTVTGEPQRKTKKTNTVF